MNLKDVSIIFEVKPNLSVAGVTREKIMPHDRLIIDGTTHTVRALCRKDEVHTAFFASSEKGAVVCGLDLAGLPNQ